MKAQQVGAFGEWATVCELLRNGWMPANINGTVKNADGFDIYAFKDATHVNLRVRACQPGSQAFQFGGFAPDQPVAFKQCDQFDYTVLVSIGLLRNDDQFFVLPTGVVHEAIIERQKAWNSRLKRDGTPRKDTGHWTLRLKLRQDGVEEGGYGLAARWSEYRNNWTVLDGPS